MNLENIEQWLYDAQGELSDVTYLSNNDDMLCDAFDGDEEEAFEFRIAFQILDTDLMRFSEDLRKEWVPDCFDDYFCAVAHHDDTIAGYDSVEEDCFGLSGYEIELAQKEASKRLERLTKKDLIDAAQRCCQISVAYLALRSRFEDLRYALDILRAKNDGLLDYIKDIEALYKKWCAVDKYDEYGKLKCAKELDELNEMLPDEIWIR